MRKILGILGAAGSIGSVIFHAIDPNALGAKGAAIYTVIGVIAALFGHPPDAQPNGATSAVNPLTGR